MTWLTGSNLMVFLVVFYTFVCVVFLFEGNYPKALYWFGALTITGAVLWMK
jgi:drug/metabolite transporter (DMT)-like permease